MNLKKKLTSTLSLVLALSMLLSTAALAVDGISSADPDSSTAYTEPQEPADPPAEDANQPDSSQDEPATESDTPDQPDTPAADPDVPAEDPDVPADAQDDPADGEEDPSPTEMEAGNGWSTVVDPETGLTSWAYAYTDRDGKTAVAGQDIPNGKYQIFYLPESKCTVDGTAQTMEDGFYAFSQGKWAKDYATKDLTKFKDIVEIELVHNAARQVGEKDCKYDGERLMSFTVKDGQSTGQLYNGRRTEKCAAEKNKSLNRRYEDGQPKEGFGLGTDKKLYYYSSGFYQTAVSLKNLKTNSCYHLFEGKLYYASSTTLAKYNAPVFTGRWTNPEDGVKRRYENGEPYNGFGLGTQSTPCLYYYVDGLYQKTTDKHGHQVYDGKKSLTELEAFLGSGKVWNGKLYVATKKTLEEGSTSPYASPLTGYRMVSGKLYKYTKGTGVLFTGIYNGTEPELSQYKGSYFSKGVKNAMPNGWNTIGGKRYYVKSGKFLTGWQYITTNGVKYKYYFDKDGVLITDLFAHFGSSWKKKPMTVRVNRNNHTADILVYDSTTKKYDIAAKSFVCSTCEKSSDFQTGTFKIKYRRRWWDFTNPKTKKTSYFQYGIRISDKHSLIHSSSYSKKSIYSLIRGNYNKLGTNQTFYCIRFQVVNAKLIYDAWGGGNKSIKIQLVKSSHNGPYGKITLADTTGKLSSKYNYDPTDPAVKK